MMTNEELERLTKAYIWVRNSFSHAQVASLATMLFRLDQDLATREIEKREKIKLDSYHERTDWIAKKQPEKVQR